MPRLVLRKKRPPPTATEATLDLAPKTNEMLFVTLSDPIKQSSFKYRTALSEQWTKIGPVKGTIDFLLTNDYNFSKKHPKVMSWNILGPEAAADGFATSLGPLNNQWLEKVTNKFKKDLDELHNTDSSAADALKNKQKYAIYAHYKVLGKNWRHYVNGTFSAGPHGKGMTKNLALDLNPTEYMERLEDLQQDALDWAAANQAERVDLKRERRYREDPTEALLKIEEWTSGRSDPIMKNEKEKTLADLAASLLKGDENAKLIYQLLNNATKPLQLREIDNRWKMMKKYIGMPVFSTPEDFQNTPGVNGPPCEVWCLQEIDSTSVKKLREESSDVDFHGFGDKAASKDCVVAWRKDLWEKATEISPDLIKAVEELNKTDGPSAAVALKNLGDGDICIFVSVHLKSGTGNRLDKRRDELSHLSAILVSMIDEEKGTPSIVIGMDANDPRGDILLRMAIQTAKETVAELKHVWSAGGGALPTEGIADEVNKRLKVLWDNYDGGKSIESGAFGDGLKEDTPWLPNFNSKFGDVVPSDHRYVMADPDREFVLQNGRPSGNFDSVKNPQIDFKAAEKAAALDAKVDAERAQASAPARV